MHKKYLRTSIILGVASLVNGSLPTTCWAPIDRPSGSRPPFYTNEGMALAGRMAQRMVTPPRDPLRDFKEHVATCETFGHGPGSNRARATPNQHQSHEATSQVATARRSTPPSGDGGSTVSANQSRPVYGPSILTNYNYATERTWYQPGPYDYLPPNKIFNPDMNN